MVFFDWKMEKGYNLASFAGWCNGSTADSGSANLGSSPSPAAQKLEVSTYHTPGV